MQNTYDYYVRNTFFSHQNNANRGGALVSDDESDEGEEGDYTVYECPGLATVCPSTIYNY